ncbi:hypothetical protein GVN21_12925 [Caulobacter sp. SLTY]|uniref:DUF4350 domain-containing protein n=1 Tax=Caulobacter sp. SLTY TaxID=2683262 RepID=UPI0014127071|nr:hypothetical protein [Caulobacter sp. SLTY]NBB16263.1 hypothetical protein [Caulobacter sp. SLTY]
MRKAQPFAPARRARVRAGPFSAMLVLWLVVIGVLAFIGSLVFGAFGSEWDKGDDGRAHALSRSAIGYAGVIELLRGTATDVEISRETQVWDENSLLILTPPIHADPETIEKVLFDGPRLIVLPKWDSGPSSRGWVRGRDTFTDKESLGPFNGKEGQARMQIRKGVAKRVLTWADGRPFARTGPIDGFRTVTGGGLTPVIVDASGGTVLGRLGKEWVLSDPDLLNTHGISDIATAKAGLELLEVARDGGGPVVFDVSLNGLKSERNLLQLILEPPFLGVTLALGLAALLLAVQAAGRFGPPLEKGRAIALGKQGLADNSAALIRLARREHRMVERYALWVRGVAARAVGAPPSLAETDLEALLDRLSDQAGQPPFTQLRREAAAAQDLGAALNAARRLYAWRLEMTRERR